MRERVRAVLADAPVVDGHNDLLWELRTKVGYDLDAIDIATDQRHTGVQTDLPRLRTGGVGAQFWSVWVPCGYDGATATVATLERIDAAYRMVARYPSDLVLARSAAEVHAAVGSGRIASLLGIEGGHSIAESLGTLRMMYALGARYMTLTHNDNTPWADSATGEPAVGGLSDFGHQVVREMNRLGMLVDLSHVAPTTMNAALDTSRAPAFFSHSSARALCDHPRNVPDDVLKRVADTDGVVMVTFVPGFLTEPGRAWMGAAMTEEKRIAEAYPLDGVDYRRLRDSWLARNPRPPCGVADVADHVEHVRQVAGVDHVGLGGDYDGMVQPPSGMTDVAGYPALLEELAGRGWSDAELGKLTFHNALRVLEATESAAR
ncbi:MAG: dipeptidase [Micromonosporaceae bacterium]